MNSSSGLVISILWIALFAGGCGVAEDPVEGTSSSAIEMFTFPSGDTTANGKIFLPASYETNENLPAIYLIDFTEQHFKRATDEFEKVIAGTQKIEGFEALVVTLEEIPDIDAEPQSFREHYGLYRDMATYVGGKYTSNTSRTFIGKGSESGVVLMALFAEDSETSMFDNFIVTDPSGLYGSAVIDVIESGGFPKDKRGKKLHFSFSSSNDYEKCTRIIRLINEAEYPWLEFEAVEYLDSDYENTYPVSFAAGIEYVYSE
jgi:hypothetical protein